jgi:hypothetical protein
MEDEESTGFQQEGQPIMPPEKIKRSLRRFRRRLASKRRQHLAFLRRQAAYVKAISAAAMGSNLRPATVELELHHGVRRLPTRQELRVQAGFHDAIRDLGPA